MDDFDHACKRVREQLDKYCTSARSSKYVDADIFTIYGADVSALKEAIYGLRHIEELAYTVAEHHPYWQILSSLTEAIRVTLERWDSDMSAKDVEDIKWCLSGVADALAKPHHHHHT